MVDCNNLVKLRKSKKMTQEQVSNYLGVQRGQVCKYELGINDIPTDVLIKMSKLYQVSLDYLILGEEAEGYIITKAEYEILMSAKEVLNNLGSRYEPSKSININNTTFNNGGDVNIKNK